MRPTAGGPGVSQTDVGPKLAANGFLPKTLPEPIKRARDQDICGFAGEGNVVERSERYASEAKPEEPKDTKRRAWAGCYVKLGQVAGNRWVAREIPEGKETR